jgi:ATP-binding cassette subfamily B protein
MAAAMHTGNTIVWRAGMFSYNKALPKIMSDLMETCYRHLLGHSQAFFADNSSGAIVSKVKRFQGSFGSIANAIIFNFSGAILRTIFIVAMMFTLHVYLGLLAVGWIVTFTTACIIFAKRKMKYDLEYASQETKTTHHLGDTVNNSVNVMLFSAKEAEAREFGGIVNQLALLRKRTWDMSNWFLAAQTVSMIILEFAIMATAAYYWSKGVLSVGDFALLHLYLNQVFERLWSFGNDIKDLYESLAQANEMTEMLLKPHEVVDKPKAAELYCPLGIVEFRNIGFSYGDKKIFDRFNLRIAPGEKIGLVGRSGGGKSTLVKLLLRYMDVESGAVLVDNQTIADVTQDSLRQRIALVPQDPHMFHRSLMDNIRYGRLDASDEEVTEAAKAAHAHEFIIRTPDGYNTLVGERGVKLSGGERQRIAIARAVLRNAPILILDEATSSLDSESEMYIQEALELLMEGRTTIAIAHRLSTIKKMDRILVMDGGNIVEEGLHEQLVSRDGIYSRLWEIQIGGFVTAK